MTVSVNFANGLAVICIKYLLRKNLYSTTPKPLITNAAHPIITDQDMTLPPTVTARDAISKSQLRFFAEDQTAPQSRRHSAFIDGRICGPYPTAEVGFEVFDWENLGYEVESRRCRHTGAVFRQDLKRRAPLRFMGWWRGQV